MRIRTVIAAAACLLTVACGGTTAEDAGDGADGGDGGADTSTGSVVTIADFDFGDIPSVTAGEAFSVENTDGATHTFTADDGTFDTGSIGGGDAASVVVDTAGDYDVRCSIHPSMVGTLTVTG